MLSTLMTVALFVLWIMGYVAGWTVFIPAMINVGIILLSVAIAAWAHSK